MKQVVILSPRAYETKIKEILKGLHLPVFSKLDIEGYHTQDDHVDLSNWFGAGKEADLGVMFFAFVPEESANKVLDTVSNWNKNRPDLPALHAYQVNVERTV